MPHKPRKNKVPQLNKAYKYRIYPTDGQKVFFAKVIWLLLEDVESYAC